MRSIQIVPLLFLIIVLSSFKNQQPYKSISGKWQLIGISDFGKRIFSNRPSNYKDTQLSFEFKDDGQQGTINGSSVNNRITGNYQLFENQKMKVLQFGGTKIGEHGWGSDFWRNIRNATSYEYSKGYLLIYFDSGKRAMKFYPQ